VTEITLPWPPKELSPNARVHWAKLAATKKAYRIECGWQTKSQGAELTATDRPMRLEVVFHKPNRRDMDRDNLLARMKSGLDGVCDALGVNDRLFDPITISVADTVGGFVKLRIFEEHDQ
jgi:crossover junction endodeoxyribonuclease RusA